MYGIHTPSLDNMSSVARVKLYLKICFSDKIILALRAHRFGHKDEATEKTQSNFVCENRLVHFDSLHCDINCKIF